MSRRPNIIFLIADDHRYEFIGINGCADVGTPNLDALGRRGTIFDEAHCQGSMHPAVCVPSRASLMTGRNIFASSCNPTADDYTTGQSECAAFTIPADLPTFPQRLRDAGYVTHAIGKWHNDRAAFARSFSSGDRIFFGGMSDHDKVPLNAFDPTGVYGTGDVHYEDGLSTDLFAELGPPLPAAQHCRRAVLPLCRVHRAARPAHPAAASIVVSPDAVTLSDNVLPSHPFDNGDALVRDETLESFPRSRDALRRHLADYYGMIAHLDAAIGSILATAGEMGLLDDTVVVYTADHGLALGQNGLMGKQNLYEHSLHVPLMMAGPGIGRACACRISSGTPIRAQRCWTWRASPSKQTSDGAEPAPSPAGRRAGSAWHVLRRLQDQPEDDPQRPLQADPLLSVASVRCARDGRLSGSNARFVRSSNSSTCRRIRARWSTSSGARIFSPFGGSWHRNSKTGSVAAAIPMSAR